MLPPGGYDIIFVKRNQGQFHRCQSILLARLHLSLVSLSIYSSSFRMFKVMEELIRTNLRFSRSRAGADYCMLCWWFRFVSIEEMLFLLVSTVQCFLVVNRIIKGEGQLFTSKLRWKASELMLCFLSLCFVNRFQKVLFLLQIITLCSVVVILFALEAMLYPYFYTCTHFHDVTVTSQELVLKLIPGCCF